MSAGGDLLDSDTRDTLASGRQTATDLWVAARSKLRRVFVVFVIGLLGTFYALRLFIWPALERDLLARGADTVAITPFDVILLQAKFGIAAGIVLSIPFFLYYAREPLKRRGLYPEDGVAQWKLVFIGLLAFGLFVGGVAYSYNLFFPIMFRFLANNAINAGLAPTYSIVDWTQFIFVLALSFGVAAQLPLVMTALAYADIVPYETFRDKWKYAVLGMFGFGALFSPPDPFTQIMWAGPLLVLYGFSLYLTRLTVALKRGGEALDIAGSVKANVNRLAAAAVLVGGVAWWFLTDGLGLVNAAVLPLLPASVRPAPLTAAGLLPGTGSTTVITATAAGVGLLAAFIATLYYAWPSLEPPSRFGDPAALDVAGLDAEGVQAAPDEAFRTLERDEVLAIAREAIAADEPEKARAVLDRYDAVDAEEEDDEVIEGTATRATTGVVNALSEDDRSEEEIGGYYYDIAFVADSMRSKAFRIFAVFITVLVAVFSFLYAGGIGTIKRDFLRRLPEVVRPEDVSVITLHPVEALVFEVKIATLLGAVATIPMLLYYAWPALKERGLARGDRNVFYGWAGALAAGLLAGSALGYFVVAPGVVSYLVYDAFRADLVIAYRVSNFFWLIFFTTVGIGLLVDIPVTMLLFQRAGILSYRAMRERWRMVVLGTMVLAAVLTPASVLSMVLVAIPVALFYGLGLLLLWIITLGGRREPPGPSSAPAD
ncbi:MAG: twin-arginine translocase subunit TatC [Halobacteriales archaeon]|nr:twin-arginine translocase subunit TatC [Halobacteriales archaeon]